MIVTHHHTDGSHWNVEVTETTLSFYYNGIADRNKFVNKLEFKNATETQKALDAFLERCKQADARA